MLGRVGAPAALAEYHAVVLFWNQVSSADGYQLRWRAFGSPTWSEWIATRSTAATIDGLTAGRNYLFEVAAVRGGVVGPDSPDVMVAPSGTVNPAPPRPRLSELSGHRLRATWNAAIDASRYQVQLRSASGSWHTVAWVRGTRFTSAALAPRRNYAIRVRPFDGYVAGGTSAATWLRVR